MNAEPECPSAEQLACLIEGALSESEVALVMHHAGECESCCELLASLARGNADDTDADEPEFKPSRGATVDRYVLLEPIGRGAMGVVWSAFDPGLKRKLAIKLVAADAMTGVSADGGKRLQREAQTMARLSHPNVVTVHAVGVVGDRLFIAMDFVEGETLGEWLESGPRAIEDVLTRFVAAGRGLADAHANGIVHRDFKPDNVLCGHDGRVCVTDFGLARAPLRVDTNPMALAVTEPELARLTRTGAFIGTPAYMAPEQFAGKPCDARSDQFSFCVALWEALYGMRPFAGRSFDELANNVRTGSIRPPPDGRTVPARLERAVRRGLCTDPSGRWPDMPSLLAVLSTRAPRSRRLLAIGSITAVLAAAGLWWVARADAVPRPCTSSTAHLVGVWDDERRAVVREALLASGTGFGEAASRGAIDRLDEHASDWVDMHTEACRAAARGEQPPAVLDQQMACLERRRSELAALADVLARGDEDVTQHAIRAASALPPVSICGDVVARRSEQPIPEDPILAAMVTQQLDTLARASALSRAGKLDEAEGVATEVVDAAAQLEWPPLRADALLVRGQLRRILGHYDAAYDDLLQAWELALSSGHDWTAALAAGEQVALATIRYAFDEGLAWSEHAFAAAQRLGNDAIEAQVCADSGTLRLHRGDHADAERLLTRALDLFEDAPDPDPVDIAETLGRLGVLALARQDLDTGIVRLRRAIELLEANLGPDHPTLTAPVMNLGVALYQRFELDEADRLFERALAIQEAVELMHPDRVTILTNLGNVALARKRATSALLYYERAHSIAVKLWGPDHIQVGVGLVNVAAVQHELGHYEEARAAFERTLDIWLREMPHHVAVAYPMAGLGVALIELGRFDEALLHLERALEIRTSGPASELDLADTERHLARALWDGGGDRARALALAKSARDRLLPLGGNASDHLVEVQAWLATHEAS